MLHSEHHQVLLPRFDLEVCREAAEFINLYSRWRGINRFPGLVRLMDVLADRVEVSRRRPHLPELASLRAWISEETKLGNPALAAKVKTTGDPELELALRWSEAVNRSISEIVIEVPPFPLVRESLESMAGHADVMVVSATPGEALEREWREHGLFELVGLVAGQELGSKKEHLALAAVGRYEPEKILMVGDALGDLDAASAAGALFFPINPGQEDESWQRFFEEGLPRFFARDFAGEYMAARVAEFVALIAGAACLARRMTEFAGRRGAACDLGAERGMRESVEPALGS